MMVRASASVAKQRIMPLNYWRLLTGGTPEDEIGFNETMSNRFGPGTHILPVGRARSGLYLLVKLAIKGSRRKVLMSPYTLPDVVTMVLLAGGEPVFYDFEPASTACDLAMLDAQIDGATACVLVTHYHVNEPRLALISGLCNERGVHLFDDCAISFGGLIEDQPMGSLTDASVFSFSSFKLLNFFWGGMITTRNAALAEGIEEAIKQWPRLPTSAYFAPAKAILRYDLASRPPVFGAATFPVIKSRLKKSSGAVGLEYVRVETDSLNATLTSRPSLAAFAEWSSKLDSVDAALDRRRSIARVYHARHAKRMVSSAPDGSFIAEGCYINYPIVVPVEWRAEIFQTLMLEGYDVGCSLYPNAHQHPKFSYLPGQSSNIEQLVASTMYLPTHFGVSHAYAEELSDCVADTIGRIVR